MSVTVSRPGQNLGTGDEKALLQRKMGAEILATLHTESDARKYFRVTNVAGAKGKRFPAVGTATGAYHTPGAEVTGQVIKHTERNIDTDDLLVASTYIDRLDEIMAEYDYRAPYSNEFGVFLAKQFDFKAFTTAVLAARASSVIPGSRPGGSQVTSATMDTSASEIAKAVFAARTQLTLNGVGKSDVAAFFSPVKIALLVQNKETINKDWGGAGSYADGSIFRIGGVDLIETVSLPGADLTDNTAITAAGLDPNLVLAKYRGDYSKTQGLVCHKDAIGIIQAMDVNTEISWQEKNRAFLIVAEMSCGAGILRPEASIEIAKT